MNWSQIAAKLSDPWAVIGFLGLAMFSSRFIVQWLYSEYHKQVVVPVAFWYLSIAGSLISLAYALHESEPVFILGYVFNCLIYFRNLYFIFRKRGEEHTHATQPAESQRKKSA